MEKNNAIEFPTKNTRALLNVLEFYSLISVKTQNCQVDEIGIFIILCQNLVFTQHKINSIKRLKS